MTHELPAQNVTAALAVEKLAGAFKLLEFAIDYIRVQTDVLEECHMHPDTKEVEEQVADEIAENREWIRKAEEAIK